MGIGIGLLIMAGFVVWEAQATEPAHRPSVVPAPGVHGSDPVDHRAVLRVLRPRLPDAAVPPAGPRRHAAGRGAEPDPDGPGHDAERTRDRARGCRSTSGRCGSASSASSLITGALVVLSRLDEESSYWLLLTGLIPLGAGMGLAMTPATTAITDALPAAKQGVGSAMNDLARELGGALGIAVLGSVLQSTYRDQLDVAADWRNRPQSRPARRSPWPRGSGRSVKHEAQVAFADGMQLAFLCAAVVVAVTAVIGGRSWRNVAAHDGLVASGPDLIGRSETPRLTVGSRQTRERRPAASTLAGMPTSTTGVEEVGDAGSPDHPVEAGGACPAPARLARDLLSSAPGLPRKLTLIRAPAGWGKSTLLADWHELESERAAVRLGRARRRRQ